MKIYYDSVLFESDLNKDEMVNLLNKFIFLVDFKKEVNKVYFIRMNE